MLPSSSPALPQAEQQHRRHALRLLLARNPFFQALTPSQVDQLAACLRPRRYAKGQPIFSRGDPGTSLLAVAEGRVRIGVTCPEGREVLLGILGPGEIFGELALLDGRARSADAAALDPCLLLTLERGHFLAVLHQSPEAALRLCEIVCGRLRAANERLEGAMLATVPARLARLLLSLTEREEATGAGLSQGDLGRLAGASRQKVNLHLGLWQAKGVLAKDAAGALRILDRKRLARIAATTATDTAPPLSPR